MNDTSKPGPIAHTVFGICWIVVGTLLVTGHDHRTSALYAGIGQIVIGLAYITGTWWQHRRRGSTPQPTGKDLTP
ncbi:hypothetical protein [Rhodococcus tibetensis]|uniref:DUF2530 domain-containing protein n=1 Tax=Rhodococcus tibetensis TaxID=2965064 RepID=A0ABT1QBI9_9NOCA|nr:hypothetical protein [Rhodococcus sp. FXJ9.536]MCQ4119587.1 hypothetical protein [Rhodococcus sp. FXJ9.536]